MKALTCRTVLSALLLCSATSTLIVGGPQAAIAAPSVSKAVSAPLQDAEKAIQAKDFQGAMAKLKDAQAVSSRTDYDNYIINRLIMIAAVGMNDMATAATAAEAVAESPSLPDTDKKDMLQNALQLSAVQKHFAKTIQYGTQLAAMNALDGHTAGMLAIAYYDTNDFPHAQQYAQQSIALAKAAGQQPDQNALQIVMSSQAKQNNQAGAEQTLEQLVLQSNSPETWGQLIGVAFGAKGMNDATAIYLYRLMVQAGAAKGSDYKEMANALQILGYPTEAVNVIQQGVSAGKISQGEVASILAKARRDAAQDERALPELAAHAAKSRTGEESVKLGEDYWGYGRYADAEAAARQAMAKGGLKTPAEAPLLIGAAQVAQGQYADGIQTLSQVSGNEGVTHTAHLWSLFAQAKQGGRAAAAPAAPGH